MSQYDKAITLLDSAYGVVGDPIKVFESLSYTDAWEKHGTISLVVGKDEMPNIKLAAWLKVDGRVYENEAPLSHSGERTVKITGPSLNVLFDRIVIKEKERLQGRLEERIRYLVNKYAITGSMRVKQLVLGTDNGFKRAIDITVNRGQKLSDVLYTALPQRGYSFEIVLVGESLVFNVLQAKDRTQTQSVNPPVVMSTAAELEDASYKKSIIDWYNFAVVCDEDETNPQTVEVDLSNGGPVRAMYVSGKKAGTDDSEATSMYVMAGQYSFDIGYIATSTDGQTWTDRVTSGYGSFWAVDYQNGMFIVCGPGNAILTSTDGVTWAATNPGLSVSLEGALYYDGAYVCVGNDSAIVRSYNASTWTLDPHFGLKLVSPIYSDDNFLAFGATGGYFVWYKSSSAFDAWSVNSILDNSINGSIVTKGLSVSGKIVVVGSAYYSSVQYPLVYLSTDGSETWSKNVVVGMPGKRYLDAAYGNGVLVAIGQPNIIAWSDDNGETWTNCTPSGGTPDYISVCFDGTTFHAYSATTKHHAYSTDGKTWTLTTFSTTATLIDAVVYGTSSHVGNLYQMGLDALEAAAIVETLDGDVNADLAPVYGVDYNVGDMIDAADPDNGVIAEKRVLEVEHLIDKTTDLSIIPKLGKDAATLREYIAKEIKNNGI